MNKPSQKITTAADLRNSIQSLEQHCLRDEGQLKESFEGFKQSLKPINLLKQLVHSVLPSSLKNQNPKLLNQQSGHTIRQLLLKKADRHKVLFVDSK